ncbi:hypothetical protein ACFQ5J_04500 [Lacticaseibacillus baoqingensis]|uniref:ATP-grasp domain-containing protein n=1 Tax=Lacticaseibacillus baoqingensis TaxID=2486013 RepID=A0ABW4E3J3_9LACO|nr:hypothetical protein [Lacticaseibacillus baoqingensis]
MYDYGQMIAELNLIGLLPQTQARLQVHLAPSAANLPSSPYWLSNAKEVLVTIPWSSDLRGITRQLTAVLASLRRAGVDTTLGAEPFTISWVLPETLFSRSYEVIATTKSAPDYLAFRNAWYVRFAQVWQKAQPQLQAHFGVSRGFELHLLGEAPQTQGIIGVQWQAVPLLANTDTGSQTQSLLWLRGALWGLLCNQLPAQLATWGPKVILDPETVSSLKRLQPGVKRQVPTLDDGVHLPGYPQLSLDSQLLLGAALATGHKIAVLDERSEVLQIEDHLVAGGATLNSAAAANAAASKLAQKALLATHGLPVAPAAMYLNLNAALHDFHTSYAHKAIAVKPICGQSGLGVAVFRLPPTEAAFAQAFAQAAAYGPVLVESYVPGASYRFFVQDGAVKAVMEMTPANVVGDGRRSVAALVSHKNARRPIGWQPVVLDDTAEAALASQGVTTETIPPRGHQVFLQTVSNARFGADGYDVTADIAAGYTDLAVQAAAALGLRIAGIDMVIPNLYQAYQADQNGMAVILSITPTPALWPHAVPQMGVKRQLASDLITSLLQA